MSSTDSGSGELGRAEVSFRDAFDRLKRRTPLRLPTNAPVTQNNVAREAGCDPSALRKSRFPSLIDEIQHWIEMHRSVTPTSAHQTQLTRRTKNRSLREQIRQLRMQRDHAASLLVEADNKILDLTLENARLQALLLASHSN